MLAEDLDHKVEGIHPDKDGRWIILDITIHKTRYTIANYYGPNDDNPIHATNMIGKIEELANPHTIIGGDFNFVFDLQKDKLNGNMKTNFKCRSTINKWMEESNMQDIWRIKNPHKRQYTWVSNNKPPIMCRLDFFLISDNLNGWFKNCDIVPGYRSDHSCITLNIEVNEETRGRGFWKFNSDLLTDETFKIDVKDTINRIAQTNEPCEPDTLWDTMKCAIRGTCISHSVRIKKTRHKTIEDATKGIQLLEERRVTEVSTTKNERTLTEIEMELGRHRRLLDEAISADTQAAAMRSKCDWYEAGDSNSKLFLNLEKARADQKCIRKLIKDDGTTITGNKDILDEEYNYYNTLYSSTKTDMDKDPDDLFTTKSPKITEDKYDDLTAEIGEDEIWKIILNNPPDPSRRRLPVVTTWS